MSEYIERGKTIGAIVRVSTRFCRDVELVANIIHAVETIPTADVRHVVRSEWIGKMTAGGMMAVCPNCGKEVRFADVSNFCPNCGADMKGGDAE